MIHDSNNTKAPRDRHSNATAGSPETLCPMYYSDDAFVNPAPNLIAVVCIVDDQAVNIDLEPWIAILFTPKLVDLKLIYRGCSDTTLGCTKCGALARELKGFNSGAIALRR